MKAEKVKPGDQMFQGKRLVYTVVEIDPNPPKGLVVALVKYQDAGTGRRYWMHGVDAPPLTRPKEARGAKG